MAKVLVIIPCYNEQENIKKVIHNLQAKAPQVDYIVVNDCSTDASEKVLAENGFHYLSLPVNLGIGGGVQSGYLYAVQNGYDVTVQMDGDGQHDPAYLQKVIAPVLAGETDMCIGSRFIDKNGFQSSFARRMGINLLSGVIYALCGVKVKDVTSGYRACNAKLTQYFAHNYAQDYPEPEAIITAVLNGYKVCEAPVVMEERMGGESSISGLKSAYYMIKVTLALFVRRMTMHKQKRKGGTSV